MGLFYFDKKFHPRMNFNPDTTDYESIRERLLITKTEDIATKMEKKMLFFGTEQLKKP